MSMPTLLLLIFFTAILIQGGHSATFTFKNSCRRTVWPAMLSNPTARPITFEDRLRASLLGLPLGHRPGRVWARTLCSTDASEKFSCVASDCGTRQISCLDSGCAPPTTLIVFTLQGDREKDFYDISCIDGFNLPVSVAPKGRAMKNCNAITCSANINMLCLPVLQEKVQNGSLVGCKSTCLAFNINQYCCRVAYGGPDTYKPTNYSRLFEKAYPQAYCNAYDDLSSTFTCVGADYLITFCPLDW